MMEDPNVWSDRSSTITCCNDGMTLMYGQIGQAQSLVVMMGVLTLMYGQIGQAHLL